MGLFFTADTHFGHYNIIKYDTRPFTDSREHDETIIRNWNEIVGPKDEVYHLGDFAFKNRRPIETYIKELNGKIHFIRGNHDDKAAWKIRHMFESAREAAYIRYEGYMIYLSHYACRTWRNSFHGSWHLYGHSHGKLPPLGLSMDVGIMLNNYYPFSFEQIKEFMENRNNQELEEKA